MQPFLCLRCHMPKVYRRKRRRDDTYPPYSSKSARSGKYPLRDKDRRQNPRGAVSRILRTCQGGRAQTLLQTLPLRLDNAAQALGDQSRFF